MRVEVSRLTSNGKLDEESNCGGTYCIDSKTKTTGLRIRSFGRIRKKRI